MKTVSGLLMVLVLAAGAGAAAGQEGRITLIDGSVVPYRFKAPCEVRANLKIGVEESPAPCRKCGDSCECVGGCGCEALLAKKGQSAPRPVPSDNPDQLTRQKAVGRDVLANQIHFPLYDVWGRQVGTTVMTVGEYLRDGGDLDRVAGMPAEHRAAVRTYVRTVIEPSVITVPVQTLPVLQPSTHLPPAPRPYVFDAGFQLRGPFGGGVSAGACVGGR